MNFFISSFMQLTPTKVPSCSMTDSSELAGIDALDVILHSTVHSLETRTYTQVLFGDIGLLQMCHNAMGKP